MVTALSPFEFSECQRFRTHQLRFRVFHGEERRFGGIVEAGTIPAKEHSC